MNHDPLTQFFYLLMRDELPTGKVERIMMDVRKSAGMDVTHSAPHLEAYAATLADEIRSIWRASEELREGAITAVEVTAHAPTVGHAQGGEHG